MKKELFDDLMASVNEAVAIKKGLAKPARVTTFETPDVKRIRARTKMKQVDFAVALGVSPSLVQAWEQNKRTPTGSSLKLLKVVDKDPELINLFRTA